MSRAAAPVLAISLLLSSAALAEAQTAQMPIPTPWMDQSKTPDERADLLQAQMTDDESLRLVKGYFGANVRLPFIKPAPPEIKPLLRATAGYVPGVPRLGIPPLVESDAGVGIANTLNMRPHDKATAFPATIMDAATWEPALAYLVGQSIAAEGRDRGYNLILDGGLNLMRDPRGGRTFEYVGEDPLLAGTTAGEEIRGLQSQHLIATAKHFALNDQETGRGILSSNIDEAAARESDVLAFEIAIEHGDPGAVMCAYNRVNGVYSCENDFLLNQVLKHDWNYPGWVLSDWGGVHSTAAAANAGLDQESASGFDRQEYFGAPLKDALANGSVPAMRLHDMVHRILRTMFAKGLFDNPPSLRTPPSTHAAEAQRAAEEGIVLLKNDGNILPLSRSTARVTIIGSHADIGMLAGGGSSQVVPLNNNLANEFPVGGAVLVLPNGAPVMPQGRQIYDPPSPLLAIAREMPNARVRFVSGEDVAAAARTAHNSDIAIVFAQQWMNEGDDVPDLSLPGRQNALIEAVAAANPNTIVVLETGGPVTMPWLVHVPAVLEAWYAGSGGAIAVSRVLFGEVNPSGRLPVTFPQSEDQLPRPALPGIDNPQVPFDVNYTEGADVGYRWFERKGLAPLFPFGFGLSYTSFHIAGLTAQGGDTITASATVTNDGSREGKQTVQFYATPPSGDPATPARLIGWSKIDLMPGQSQQVTITADPRLLAHFDAEDRAWHLDEGKYVVRVGSSATQTSATAEVEMQERTIKP